MKGDAHSHKGGQQVVAPTGVENQNNQSMRAMSVV